MPCRDYESDGWGNGRRAYGEVSTYEYDKLKKQADKLARIACSALAAMEAGESYENLIKTKEVSTWWTAHKKADAAVTAAETKAKEKKAEATKLKEQALAKLTPEELAVFGLDKKGKK